MVSHSFCDPGRITNPQHSGHLLPWGSAPGLHSGHTRAQLKAASSSEVRRWQSEPPEGSSRSAPLLKSQVSTTLPSCRHKSRVRSNNAMHRYRLSHALLLDERWSIPKLARDEVRHTRVVGLEDVLVQEECAAILGSHMEVPLQSHVVAEARVLLHADHMPWAVEVTCQQARVRTPYGSGIPGKEQ